MLRILILASLLQCLVAFQAALPFQPSFKLASSSVRRPLALRMGCPLTPLGANVIVVMEKEVAETQRPSGILLAASVKAEGPKTGTVAAVGDGWHTDTGVRIPITEVKIGDKVYFREPNALESRKMKVGGEEYVVLSVNDIMAKLNS
uniref:Uncharacterized protein n=1 Tax=Cryptomonas paramaecium TaxID=2898 RepID=A0A7S4PQX1_9CRYP|mmetsp:Transcript_1043/g.2671  ORF Transcript_1043/g.2671 Transcript_1043/m.2671 type:complete len:147 (+) Transcript_1043:37-477(+)